jgi:hypothetical protein
MKVSAHVGMCQVAINGNTTDKSIYSNAKNKTEIEKEISKHTRYKHGIAHFQHPVLPFPPCEDRRVS